MPALNWIGKEAVIKALLPYYRGTVKGTFRKNAERAGQWSGVSEISMG